MPKKSQKTTTGLKEAFYQFAKYRWEFQRRNEAYRQWWQEKRPRENLKYPDPDLSFEQLIDFLRPSADILTSKLVNKKYISEEDRGLVESHLFSFFVSQFTLPGTVELLDTNNDLTILELKIDLKKINSLSPLVDLVGLMIRDYHHLLTQLNLLPSAKSQNYRKDYERILSVGDMKRAGKKRTEIAEELAKHRVIAPSRWKNCPESVIRSISDDWEKYKDLVNGGYLEITYP